MKAEKTRSFLDSLDCCACSRVYEIMEKGICTPDCKKEYRLDDEIQKELTELEAKAAKWEALSKSVQNCGSLEEFNSKLRIGEMIKWAVENVVDFVDTSDREYIDLSECDIERLKKLYAERGGE